MMRRRTTATAAAALTGGLISALAIALTAGAHSENRSPQARALSGQARVIANYRIFRTAASTVILPANGERLAQALEVTDPALPADVRTGTRIAGSERLLFAAPGSVRDNVYGVAMSAGRACILIPGMMAGCDRGRVQTEPVAWLSGGPVGGPAVIAGLARNGVKSVAVVVAGHERAAQLANNAFYLEVPLSELGAVSALLLTMTDGSLVPIDLPTLG